MEMIKKEALRWRRVGTCSITWLSFLRALAAHTSQRGQRRRAAFSALSCSTWCFNDATIECNSPTWFRSSFAVFSASTALVSNLWRSSTLRWRYIRWEFLFWMRRRWIYVRKHDSNGQEQYQPVYDSWQRLDWIAEESVAGPWLSTFHYHRPLRSHCWLGCRILDYKKTPRSWNVMNSAGKQR